MNKPKTLKTLTKRSTRCSYCGQHLDERSLIMDHFIPVCEGGGRGANMVPACHACNNRKGPRNLEQFRNLCRLYVADVPGVKLFPIGEDLLATMERSGVLFPCLPSLSEVRFYFEDLREDFVPVFRVPVPWEVR